ncbi:hypothetical protein EJ063_02550 [Vibrio aquaticus]|uniref:Uncharacterized protein n=1 Tax=Vibrio aquaticus TaxID=2496559 RepID=A0A3S0V4L7_9VIBR|nr:hypothetical protein [Vibrio aquaticus]RTZ17685.1 hypothetical protein EJ063_02550 [Vibrio aquaticus]
MGTFHWISSANTLTIERCFFIIAINDIMRNLVIVVAGLLSLTACSTTTNTPNDEEMLTNQEKASTAVEITSSQKAELESTHQITPDDQSKAKAESSHEPAEIAKAKEAPQTKSHSKSNSSKSSSEHYLLNNEPTKQVMKSLEDVADTLNLVTFGIFATGHR